MKSRYEDRIAKMEKASFIIIDKGDMTLKVYNNNGRIDQEYPIGLGINYGNKQEKGDLRTPEGVYPVQEILDAKYWKHDFGDGKGEIPGAYGPYFIRLNALPHTGIGIHGTHDPASIGTRCTEGCIRLNNENVLKLKELVYPGMPVIIVPGEEDAIANFKQKD